VRGAGRVAPCTLSEP